MVVEPQLFSGIINAYPAVTTLNRFVPAYTIIINNYTPYHQKGEEEDDWKVRAEWHVSSGRLVNQAGYRGKERLNSQVVKYSGCDKVAKRKA